MSQLAAIERIAIDPDILHGKPRVKGTRIPVCRVLELLAEGISPDEVIEEVLKRVPIP